VTMRMIWAADRGEPCPVAIARCVDFSVSGHIPFSYVDFFYMLRCSLGITFLSQLSKRHAIKIWCTLHPCLYTTKLCNCALRTSHEGCISQHVFFVTRQHGYVNYSNLVNYAICIFIKLQIIQYVKMLSEIVFFIFVESTWRRRENQTMLHFATVWFVSSKYVLSR
jgi:hypothetical protein